MYAVYCGSGEYVQSARLHKDRNLFEIGGQSGAFVACRAVAVGVLHIVRAAGMSAWLVRK